MLILKEQWESAELLNHSEVHIVREFTLIAGLELSLQYHWDSTGGQSGSGTMTVVVVSAVQLMILTTQLLMKTLQHQSMMMELVLLEWYLMMMLQNV